LGHQGGQIVSKFCDRGIGVGPIGFDLGDAVTLEGVANGAGFEDIRFVEFAGEAPGRGEIDEDGVALFELNFKQPWSEWLPATQRLGFGRTVFAAANFSPMK